MSSQISNREAAIQLLVSLSSSTQQWPSNSGKMTAFIQQHVIQDKKSRFSVWIRQKQGEQVKLSKIRKTLVHELLQMKVIVPAAKNGGIAKFTWSMIKVKAFLEGNESVVNVKREPLPPAHGISMRESELPGVRLVDTLEQLETLKDTPPFTKPSDQLVVAVDCEGVPNELYLVQVGTTTCTFVFDCIKLGPQVVCEFLSVMLTNPMVTKLFHDLHNDAAALATIGGVDTLCGTLDTQLAVESWTGQLHVGFNQLLNDLGQAQHDSKHAMKKRMNNGQIFAHRPLPRDVLQYAVDDVHLLTESYDRLCERLGDNWGAIQRASDLRAQMAAANGGARHICFDVPNSYAITSYELLFVLRPDDMMTPSPLEVSNEPETLLGMLPEDLSSSLTEHARVLSDVVLDKGRRPHAWIGGERLLLGDESRLVDSDEIAAIVEKLGGFGTDNRAGLERQLHRISAIRNRDSEIIGLTLRFGRHVSGNTGIISDLLFGDPTKSILFLGEPGAGKTTVVREVTRLLAERHNVCIVDTSNEIAGDGDVPHPCVGFARRMMVPSLDRQSAVMIECVQNHTPEVMVIDEIGRPTEVEAARTCKNRGVRLIASAHGDLRKLIKNPKLRGLIGGVETVTLGDMQAKAEAKKNPGGSIQKTKAERAGPPTFDVLVELKRGAHHEWRIVLDSGDAVDRVLRREEYKAQRRIRDPETGSIHLDLEMA